MSTKLVAPGEQALILELLFFQNSVLKCFSRIFCVSAAVYPLRGGIGECI